jgi:predicted nucleic acid-binding protein
MIKSMDRRLFVDTAGWMSMADRNDKLHHKFVSMRDEWLEKGNLLLTTDYVIDETLTLIRMRIGIDGAEAWWGQVSDSPRLKVEWIHFERAEKARRWFFKWQDKSFSFTDCTSFVVMKELKLRKALTVLRLDLRCCRSFRKDSKNAKNHL